MSQDAGTTTNTRERRHQAPAASARRKAHRAPRSHPARESGPWRYDHFERRNIATPTPDLNAQKPAAAEGRTLATVAALAFRWPAARACCARFRAAGACRAYAARLAARRSGSPRPSGRRARSLARARWLRAAALAPLACPAGAGRPGRALAALGAAAARPAGRVCSGSACLLVARARASWSFRPRRARLRPRLPPRAALRSAPGVRFRSAWRLRCSGAPLRRRAHVPSTVFCLRRRRAELADAAAAAAARRTLREHAEPAGYANASRDGSS